MMKNGYLTILPSVGTIGGGTSGLKDTSVKMSVFAMEQFSATPHANKTNAVLSGIGGLELYSVADSVATAVLVSGSIADDTVSPMVSSTVHDIVFDDGETAIGPSVSSNTSMSNQSYVSGLTNHAVNMYANGDANLAAGVGVDNYLSHKNAAAQGSSAESQLAQNTASSARSTSYFALLAAASLAAISGIVIIVVSKQKKISY